MNNHHDSPALVPSLPEPLPRILVVEDDVFLRQLSIEVLARSGYEVDLALDGAAAWDALQTNRYNLLITENDLSDLTGVELLQKMRSANMGMPVIVATGTMPEVEFAECRWIQPVALLPKPYAVSELLGAVSDVLNPIDGKCGPIVPPPARHDQRPAFGLQP